MLADAHAGYSQVLDSSRTQQSSLKSVQVLDDAAADFLRKLSEFRDLSCATESGYTRAVELAVELQRRRREFPSEGRNGNPLCWAIDQRLQPIIAWSSRNWDSQPVEWRELLSETSTQWISDTSRGCFLEMVRTETEPRILIQLLKLFDYDIELWSLPESAGALEDAIWRHSTSERVVSTALGALATLDLPDFERRIEKWAVTEGPAGDEARFLLALRKVDRKNPTISHVLNQRWSDLRRGDTLMELDGRLIESIADYKQHIASHDELACITARVLRGDRALLLTLPSPGRGIWLDLAEPPK